MRVVSQDYYDAMDLDVREMDAYIEMIWVDPSQQQQLAAFTRSGVGSPNIIGAIKSIKLRTSTGGKIAGAIVSQQMILEVMGVESYNEYKVENGRFLTLQIGPMYRNTEQHVFYNAFYVSKIEKNTTSGVYTITAWDYISTYFDTSAVGVIPSGTYTPQTYLNALATACNMNSAQIVRGVNTSISFDSTYVATRTGTTDRTLKQVLQDFVIMTGTNAFSTLDDTGHIVLKLERPYTDYDRTGIIDDIELMNAGMAVPLSKYFDADIGKVQPVVGVQYDRHTYYSTATHDGYLLKLDSSPTLENFDTAGGIISRDTAMRNVANSFYNSVSGELFNVSDYEIDWRADPKLELNDLLCIGLKNGSLAIVPCTEINLDYDGGLRENIKFTLET